MKLHKDNCKTLFFNEKLFSISSSLPPKLLLKITPFIHTYPTLIFILALHLAKEKSSVQLKHNNLLLKAMPMRIFPSSYWLFKVLCPKKLFLYILHIILLKFYHSARPFIYTYNIHIFRFSKECQMAFQSGNTNLHFYWQYMRVSVILYPHLLLSL